MKYIIGILALAFVGCLPPTVPPNKPAQKVGETYYVESAYTGNGTSYLYLYTIDSCEYIGSQALNSNYAILTHKGNCKYCLQRNK